MWQIFQEDYEFAYEANRSQINALAGVSNIVRQDLSVNCYNTIAYYDSSTSDYTNAVHLRGFNEAVLTPGGRRKRKGGLKYNVDENEDECQVRSIASSVFQTEDFAYYSTEAQTTTNTVFPIILFCICFCQQMVLSKTQYSQFLYMNN